MANIFLKHNKILNKFQISNQLRKVFNMPLNQESFMSATSSTYLEDMYRLWQVDPKQVHPSWDAYFRGVDAGRPVGSAYVSPPNLSTLVGRGAAKPSVAPTPASGGVVRLFQTNLNFQVASYQTFFIVKVQGNLLAFQPFVGSKVYAR